MTTTEFTTIRTEGAILPPDMLARIASGTDLVSIDPAAYGLAGGESLGEAISSSWNRLVGVWKSFDDQRSSLPTGDTGTSLTRDRWLRQLLHELGFGRVPALGAAVDLDGKHFAISHMWGPVPLHLVGCNVSLDTKTHGVAGAAKASPHGLCQDFLNRSDDHLWGVVSNGVELRLLRDNVSLTRPAYVSFDVEGMFNGDDFAGFRVLWLACHASRFDADRPELCVLERWYETAIAAGTRAQDHLRIGVTAAIDAFGAGFLAHPANSALKGALRTGALSTQDYYRQLLRVVYRLLVLFVAEDRDALHPPGADAVAVTTYHRHYSTARLRRLAERRLGSTHADLWQAHTVVVDALADPAGCAPLALAPLGGLLFSLAATPALAACRLSNRAFLDALRALATIDDTDTRKRRRVDYRNLAAEELGSIYESLLELVPEINVDAAHFSLATAAGNERKTSGSYYTPHSLVTTLLDSALDPVLDDRIKNAPDTPTAIEAVLSLRVVDPAVGSGHFLVAAGHRIARRVAMLRSGDDEPSPDAIRVAMRDVVGRCLHGVDLNPMAAELCKVALWMESLEPGKPLGFLDHHIVVGNSLLGTTPELVADGIPDKAFDPLTGDDKAVAKSLKAANKAARKGALTLDLGDRPTVDLTSLSAAAAAVEAAPDDTVAAIAAKAGGYRELVSSLAYTHAKAVADTWCAAFVWPATPDAPPAPTQEVLDRLLADPDALADDTRAEVERLTDDYQFMHWHIVFPDAMAHGGFDLVLGNPPWERVKLAEKEFFASADPDIAKAPNAAARGRMIKALETDDPPLYQRYRQALRNSEGSSHFMRNSGRYPLCGRGDVNLYTVFAESMRNACGPAGHVGVIVPSGIATDDTTKFFFQDLVERRSLVSLFEFENRGFFAAIGSGHMNRFCLLTLTGESWPSDRAVFVFRGQAITDVDDPDRCFTLTAADFALLNPNTRTCPIFRTRRDADITRSIYERVPVLIDEAEGPAGNPWGISFSTMFHMSNDSALFRTRDQIADDPDAWLPLYEAKMAYHYDHRFGDWALLPVGEKGHVLPSPSDDLHADPDYVLTPRYWVPDAAVHERLDGKWGHDWLLGWRDISNDANARTVIAAIIPRVGVGNKFPLMLLREQRHAVGLVANLSAFALDYAARQKIGGTTLNFFLLKQLPVLPPSTYDEPAPWDPGVTIGEWIAPRVLELTYTAWDLRGFARDLGYDGPPFRWDPDRRFRLRCELDAAFFHLYGLARDDVDYVMDTFPIVARHDTTEHGTYRTKDLVLTLYDAMATGTYQTILDPGPADPAVAHSLREESR